MKDDAMLNVVEELGKKEMLRDIHGFYEALTKEMEQMDSELFFQTYRMDKEKLDSILTLIKADIQKQDTVMRPSILAKARLAVTLSIWRLTLIAVLEKNWSFEYVKFFLLNLFFSACNHYILIK
ncbi:uncharacterized protein LOC136038279 isoform X1 [Artemia franciscana]|uniref:uncharacterized protein LOC136038279 isoform X1 n=1 Tax=Artemia franciscana TaxID=6661 RepID=UPI0032DBD06D